MGPKKIIEIPIEDPQEMADRLRDDEPIYDEDYIGGCDDSNNNKIC